jgi:transposase
MTLSLLVYSIAQRRMRATMKKIKASIPNQINQATETPTLRWVFQCFEGINLIYKSTNAVQKRVYIEGLDELRMKIVQLIGGRTKYLYKIEKVT